MSKFALARRAKLPCVLLAFAVAPSAQATVLVSNLAEPVRATTSIEQALWAAQSFSTDASAYSLTSIRTILGSGIGSFTGVAELRAGTTTGALLTSFTLGSLAGPQGIQTLTPLSSVMLAPSSIYWLILGATGTGSFGWSYAQGNNQTGPGALGSYEYSSDQGAIWGAANTDDPYLIEVNVTSVSPVPEPATWAMMILGFGLIGAAMRRPAGTRVSFA